MTIFKGYLGDLIKERNPCIQVSCFAFYVKKLAITMQFICNRSLSKIYFRFLYDLIDCVITNYY